MSENALLLPAIIIFSALIVGLVYTVIEFAKMRKDSDKRDAEK